MNIVADKVENNVGAPTSDADEVKIQWQCHLSTQSQNEWLKILC